MKAESVHSDWKVKVVVAFQHICGYDVEKDGMKEEQSWESLEFIGEVASGYKITVLL